MQDYFQKLKDEGKKYFSVNDVASLLDVTPRTVHRWMAVGYLPHFRVERAKRVPVDVLESFIEKYMRRKDHADQ